MKRMLRQYQKNALRYCIRTQHPALFQDMGTGKSLVLIRFAKLIFAERILIVCPFSAIDGWQDELKLDSEPRALELTGTKQKRIKMLGNLTKWNIINKEGHLAIPEICQIDWDILCIDESVILKNPRTKVSKFFVRNFHHVKHRAILTGMPAPKGDLDYFQQFQFLNPSILKSKNFYHWRYRNFNVGYHDYTMRKNYKEEFRKILADNCFFLSREEAGLAGQEVEQRRLAQFTERKHVNLYNELVEKFVLGSKRTKYIPVALTWLRQLCSGFVNNKLVFKSKLNLLLELLNGELKGKQVVIWCQYICEIKAIQKAINENVGIIYGDVNRNERALYKYLFNAGEIKYLICHPECFRYGSDLSGADTAIYFSAPRDIDQLEQTKRRLTRGEKKDFVLYIYLAMKNSIEVDIIEGLQQRKTESEIVRNIIKCLQIKNNL